MKVHFSYGIILFQHVMRSVLAELSNTIALGPNEVAIMEDEFEIGYVQSLILEDTPLYSSKSVYQDIKMYQSKHYGKVFVLDDCLQLTERDAAHYNEMLAHVPIAEYMAKNADKINSSEAFLRVLVIGGTCKNKSSAYFYFSSILIVYIIMIKQRWRWICRIRGIEAHLCCLC